jgi:hypothetical protein
MKNLMVCGVLFLAAACAAPAAVTVEHFGVMREVMMEGKTEARVALADYEHPGFYGVGALAGLQGEVLIDDGFVFVVRERARAINLGNIHLGKADWATLLTVARVGEWREVALAERSDLDAIERAVAEAVPDSRREGAAPVPFRLRGRFDSVALHVARGACPHAATSPETEPDRWSGDGMGVIVGFYAPGRAGVMTHHGTAIHAHALVSIPEGDYIQLDGSVMGHVDSLVCGPGTKLFVPAR